MNAVMNQTLVTATLARTAITADFIRTCFAMQQSGDTDRTIANTVSLDDIRKYAVKCADGYALNLVACQTEADYQALNAAVKKLLHVNAKDYYNARVVLTQVSFAECRTIDLQIACFAAWDDHSKEEWKAIVADKLTAKARQMLIDRLEKLEFTGVMVDLKNPLKDANCEWDDKILSVIKPVKKVVVTHQPEE